MRIQPPGDLVDRLSVRDPRIQPLPAALWIQHDRLAIVDNGERLRSGLGQDRTAGIHALLGRFPEASEKQDIVRLRIL
jgi:hypothetical protein